MPSKNCLREKETLINALSKSFRERLKKMNYLERSSQIHNQNAHGEKSHHSFVLELIFAMKL